MRKITPAVEVIICDKCGKENARIDLTVKASFVGRDWSGAAVGGYTNEYDLCNRCSTLFEEFFK